MFCAALALFAFVYPLTISQTSYSYPEVLLMVLLIGANGATQILFIGKYKALLMASQMNGINLTINALSTVLYSILLALGAYAKFELLVGISIATSAYLFRGLAYYIAVKIKMPQYSFCERCKQVDFPQRGAAFISQILTMVSLNGGIIVLSLMRAPMEQISVYTTYNLVLSGLYMLMYSIENSVTAALGDLSASSDMEHIRKSYHWFDSVYHLVWTVVVACLSALLIPFIEVYTSGVSDIEYVLPVEAILFILIGAFWMLRNEETLLMSAKGRFQDMQGPMCIEACIVIIGGGIFYLVFGMKGLLTAKLVSALYMAKKLVQYTHTKLLYETTATKLKNVGISLLEICLILILSIPIGQFFIFSNFFIWIIYAIICGTISTIVTGLGALFFHKELLNGLLKKRRLHSE